MKFYNLIFIALLVGCSLFKQENDHKSIIDYDSVEFVSIKKELYATDSIYFLTGDETRTLVDEWNAAELEGMNKMIPEFWVRVHLKNDSIRLFRTSGNFMKEDSDWTYVLSNANLFSNLWKNAQAIPPRPELINLIGECDSISEKAKTDYENGVREYTVLGLVESTEFEMFYSNYMQQNYNISMKANCVPTMLDECYAEAMIAEIEKEYGADFIEQVREKAKVEFDKR